MEINKELIQQLFDQAVVNPRMRQNLDLRTSSEDKSQRMLNALLPGTEVPIHRHPMSNENVILLCGKLVEIYYNDNGEETERIHLDPTVGNFGCVVPAGVWHTVEVLEPSVIYEAKDGKYGEDGSESFEDYKKKILNNGSTKLTTGNPTENFKEQITYLIGMERQSGSMEVCSPLYVSRMLNVPLEEVEKAMREMGV